MNETKAKILLAAVFMARGTSFLFSKTLLRDMTPLSILAVRFTLSFLILAVLFHKKLLHTGKEELRGGTALGTMYTICMLFEMYGLQRLDSGVSSLIENMAIILVPVIAAILTRTLPRRKTVFCAILAVIGVGFLSLTQRHISGSALGIALAIGAAVTYAMCIMMTENFSKNAEPIAVGVIQLGTMGILSLIISLFTGTFGFPQDGTQWGLLLLLVFVCSCFGFTFQPVGQKYVPAETAAVFSVVNPLTASVMGVTIAGEAMSALKLAGYVFVLASLVIYNLQAPKADA